MKLSFEAYERGNYELQLVDLNGKVLNTQTAMINSKVQVMEYKIPAFAAKGTYLLKVISNSNKIMNVEKIIVQ